jgi:RNA polymerase sigma-70 factor (ECF subfamily)
MRPGHSNKEKSPGASESFAEDGKFVLSILNLFKGKTKPADRFERLLRPHIDTLYRLAFRLSNSQEDAEELVQHFLTRIFEKIDQLEAIEKPAPWLCRGLYNLYVDGYRKTAREITLFNQDEFSDDTAVHMETPFQQASNAETLNSIDTALQQLNHNQRAVVLLHDAEGYTLKELSEILQVPEGTLKSRLHRARTELKKLLVMEPFPEPRRVTGIKR